MIGGGGGSLRTNIALRAVVTISVLAQQMMQPQSTMATIMSRRERNFARCSCRLTSDAHSAS